jgi:hypothetical protein
VIGSLLGKAGQIQAIAYFTYQINRITGKGMNEAAEE